MDKTLDLDTNCQFCHHKDVSLKLKIDSLADTFLVPELANTPRYWLKCDNCQLYFSQPLLTSSQLDYMYQRYRDEEFRHETPQEYFDRIASLSNSQSENFNKIKFILDSTSQDYCPESTLDIGCGGGVLIHKMSGVWPDSKFVGVEPTPSFAQLTRNNTKADVICSYFQSDTLYGQKFDLITCCQVLEHIPDVKDFLQNIRKHMHQSSNLYLEVPDSSDFDTLPALHSRFSEPSHLWYFSKESIIPLLSKCKLTVNTVKVIKTVRGRNNLMILATKAPD